MKAALLAALVNCVIKRIEMICNDTGISNRCSFNSSNSIYNNKFKSKTFGSIALRGIGNQVYTNY